MIGWHQRRIVCCYLVKLSRILKIEQAALLFPTTGQMAQLISQRRSWLLDHLRKKRGKNTVAPNVWVWLLLDWFSSREEVFFFLQGRFHVGSHKCTLEAWLDAFIVSPALKKNCFFKWFKRRGEKIYSPHSVQTGLGQITLDMNSLMISSLIHWVPKKKWTEYFWIALKSNIFTSIKMKATSLKYSFFSSQRSYSAFWVFTFSLLCYEAFLCM